MIKKISVNDKGIVTLDWVNGHISTMSINEAKESSSIEVRRAIARLWPVRF